MPEELGDLEEPPQRTSLRRIEANRRNALRSTGPRTTEGKNASKWNALQHGLLAKNLVALCDGPDGGADLNKLLTELRTHFQPIGMLEEMLVEKIAVSYFKLSRALRIEKAVLGGFLLNPGTLSIKSDAISLSLRYGSTIERDLFRALDQLERVQRQRNGETIPAPLRVSVSAEK
jgi:hypothetical protein